jgi:hypothetical protein
MVRQQLNIFFPIACTLILASCGKKDECSGSSDCDDGIFCNGEEFCVRGRCSASLSLPCDDGLQCSIDTCDEAARDCAHEPPDFDGDGYFLLGCLDGDDCNDFDPAVHPGAPEMCNGKDNNCDGIVDGDKDRDGHLDPAACPGGDDCDDDDPDVHPGAPEICDGIDNNCVDGTADEADTDVDGYTDETCGGNDCDDENADLNPGAAEQCNGEDDNCDGLCDETFDCCRGETYTCDTTCGSTGTVTCSGDCELGPCVPPAEMCNGLDDDCNGEIDDHLPCLAGALVACETVCGTDGMGSCTAACQLPPPEDCLPPAEECNGLDDDCDGDVDETFPCRPGETTLCVTTCNSQGSGECTEACGMPAPADCTPPEEFCWNFKDDDCDGDVDEFCY